ncbi:MAG: MOSC domain-containing protein [Terriglobia bacterium]
MRIASINVSKVREISHSGSIVRTGIFKVPVSGRVRLRPLSLDGDDQADLENHGGIYKAVYAYPAEHYEFWMQQINRSDLAFGQFGENLTVEGLLEDEIHVGDIFQVGSAVVEVTQPRTPCYKLGIKMGLPEFPKRFLASGRVGFYLRVIQEGEIGAGDTMECTDRDPESMSVREISHLKYFDRENLKAIKKALKIRALSPQWRDSFGDRSAELMGRLEEREGLEEAAKPLEL